MADASGHDSTGPEGGSRGPSGPPTHVPEGSGDLFEALYSELRRVAGRVFGSRRGETLNPTALVHEAWLRLPADGAAVVDRSSFLALAAHAMRHVLIDHARARGALKRGGAVGRAATVDLGALAAAPSVDPIALGDSLDRLARLKERHARVVELRIFAGLTIEETAREVGVATSTVQADWAMARAWLRSELSGDHA